MKKLSAVLFVVCFSVTALCQITTRNFNVIRKNFYAEYNRLVMQGKIEKGEKNGDGLMAQFHRWEYLMKSRTFPSGNIPAGDIQWKEWQRYQSTHAGEFDVLTTQPKWQQVGTNAVPAYGGGAGRVNVVRLDPVDTNIIYLGAASGGI